jgi:tRNA-specific 2-thiouridylase
MSGGVDSSVAAALLHEQGHEVVGVWMRLHDVADSYSEFKKSCCSLDAPTTPGGSPPSSGSRSTS